MAHNIQHVPRTLRLATLPDTGPWSAAVHSEECNAVYVCRSLLIVSNDTRAEMRAHVPYIIPSSLEQQKYFRISTTKHAKKSV